MDRATFCQAALAAVVAPPAGTPSPATVPSPNPWDACDKSVALPYDKPLDMTMQVLDGPDFHLVNYRERPVLLNIFATWCGPCNKEQPALVELAQKYAPQGLVVIGVNDAEPDDTVRAYRKKYGITYPIAMDRKGFMTLALQDRVSAAQFDALFPTDIFIDTRGYLYCYRTGGMSRDELEYRIEKFLASA